MKARRRIAGPKLKGCADYALEWHNYSRDLRPVKWGSGVSLHGSNPDPLMSALGQKQTLQHVRTMSALPPKADIGTDTVLRGDAASGEGAGSSAGA
jgi:hypothetical protein